MIRNFGIGAAVLAMRKRTFSITPASDSPNILFCISDDQSWLHASAYGSRMVKTPFFDRMAREGILFTQAYVSSPTCCPSRGSVLTGQTFYRLGEGAQNWGTLDRSYKVYPDLLEAAGYHVGCTGKGWAPGDWKAAGRTRNPSGPVYSKLHGTPPTKDIASLDYAANFRDFLDGRHASRPFCFWYGGFEPHREYEKDSGLRAGKKLEDAEVPSFLPDNGEVRADLLDYALEIEWFDTHLGRMIQLLEDTSELESTIVVVTSDNGMSFPRCKGQLYDFGTRVPLAVRWGNRIKGGRVINDFVSFTDFAPTFLEAAGIEQPPDMTGKSFLDLLLSDKSGRLEVKRDHVITGRERFFPESLPYPCRAIRTERYLYIRNYKPERYVAGPPPDYPDTDGGVSKISMASNGTSGPGRWLYELALGKRPAEELYDLERDPHQMHNIVSDVLYAEVKEELSERLQRELVRTGDPRVLGKGEAFDRYAARRWDVHTHQPLRDRK